MKTKLIILFIAIFLVGVVVANVLQDQRTISRDLPFREGIFFTQNDSDNGTHVYTEIYMNGFMLIGESIPFATDGLRQSEIDAQLDSDWNDLLDVEIANKNAYDNEVVVDNYNNSRNVIVNIE